jgi:hypothetical protein
VRAAYLLFCLALFLSASLCSAVYFAVVIHPVLP